MFSGLSLRLRFWIEWFIIFNLVLRLKLLHCWGLGFGDLELMIKPMFLVGCTV